MPKKPRAWNFRRFFAQKYVFLVTHTFAAYTAPPSHTPRHLTPAPPPRPPPNARAHSRTHACDCRRGARTGTPAIRCTKLFPLLYGDSAARSCYTVCPFSRHPTDATGGKFPRPDTPAPFPPIRPVSFNLLPAMHLPVQSFQHSGRPPTPYAQRHTAQARVAQLHRQRTIISHVFSHAFLFPNTKPARVLQNKSECRIPQMSRR